MPKTMYRTVSQTWENYFHFYLRTKPRDSGYGYSQATLQISQMQNPVPLLVTNQGEREVGSMNGERGLYISSLNAHSAKTYFGTTYCDKSSDLT